MQITFTARHFKASESLKSYAENEVNRLNKFFEGIVDCDIILSKERNNNIAEISLKVSSGVLSVKESSEDFYKSIDLAVDKLERQIKKFKDKIHSYSHKKINEVLLPSKVMEGEEAQ